MNSLLVDQVRELSEEVYLLSYLSNVIALLNDNISDINWVGFYFDNNIELVLGPFQGKIACSHIKYDKGVCGSSFSNREVIVVDDVHKFVGHIACDSDSNSEIVLPLIYNGKCFGVLDIDSYKFSRFAIEDKNILIDISKLISEKISLYDNFASLII